MSTFILSSGSIYAISGNLIIDPNTDFYPYASGQNNLGSLATPYSGVYADNLFLHGAKISNIITSGVNAGSGIGVFSDVAGSSLELKTLQGDGGIFITASGNDTIVISGSNTGAFIPISGGTMTGQLNFISGVGISGTNLYISSPSGINTTGSIIPKNTNIDNIGSTLSSFNNIYANSIYENGLLVINSGIGLGNVSVTQSGSLIIISGATYALPPNVITSGVGLGNVTVAQSGNILTISGTQYILPTNATFTQLNVANLSGTSISGLNFTVASGGSILPAVSGGASIGAQGLPFNKIFSNYISGTCQVIFVLY